MSTIEQLKYPIGKYVAPEVISASLREQWITDIRDLPQQITTQLSHMTPEHLATPYREGGWTGHQLVHHLADSHMNSLIRFKLALTEDNPTIKPYQEGAWAELPDTQYIPLEVSLQILAGVHARWAVLLQHMIESDWARTFFHPESQEITQLDTALGNYAWHGKHHLAHLRICASQ